MNRNMQITKRWNFFIILVFLCVGFVFMASVAANAAPKGKAAVAALGVFGMRGGDVSTSTSYGSTLQSMLHERLIAKYADGKFHPAIAKSWEFGPGMSYMKFTLDNRPKFHDGTSVTAEDVKFSIERAMRKEMKHRDGATMRRMVKQVDILDNGAAVMVSFKSPYPDFIEVAGRLLGIVPKAYVEKVGDAEYAKNPIGAGPFKAVKFKQDVFFELEAVDDHYRKVPHVKYLKCSFVQEDTTRMAMLKTGEVDVCHLPYGTFWEIRDDPKFRVVYSMNAVCATLGFFDLAFPDMKSPFHDLRVRKATALAIDRKMICEKVFHGLYTPGGSFLAPYTIGYDPSIKMHPYDPEQAKALLKEAGYPNGFDTTLDAGIQYKTTLNALAASLAKVGIRATVSTPESGMHQRLIREKKLTGLGRLPGPWWQGRTHPGSALDHFVAAAIWSYYTPPEIDKAMYELMALTDEKEIAKKAREITKKYAEDYIRAPLWIQNIPFGLGPRVKYWEPTPGRVFPVNFEFLELKDQ